MTDEKKATMIETESIAAVGGLWFDTAIAKMRFSGDCCQQVAGCCQRVSVASPLKPEELMKRLNR